MFKRFILTLAVICSLCANASAADVIAGGKVFGIKAASHGVTISEITPVGTRKSPVEAAGLQQGDIITAINGEEVKTITDLNAAVKNSGGKALTFTVKRADGSVDATVTPITGEDGSYKIGAWIRDKVAGIGTFTFYDRKTKLYGALGHGITNENGELIPVVEGDIVGAAVVGAKPGLSGAPGELKGEFDTSGAKGDLRSNTETGIFGYVFDESVLGDNLVTVETAEPSEVTEGKAVIYANLSGGEVSEFEIEIIRLYDDDIAPKNFMIKVTDEALLEQTGGIVQGMSGSPIMQNGKLVGAVTHVLINDPKRGYGVFIRTMFETARSQLGVTVE